MTFPVNAIPNANDLISNSQSQIQNNFSSIIGWAAVDHVGFGTIQSGQHNRITFADVSTQSTPSDPISILYTKNDASSHPQLFFLNSQNSTQYVANAQGSTVLMGGIILKWGSLSVSAGGSAVFTFPGGAFPNACFSVFATPRLVGVVAIGVGVPSTSAVTVYLGTGPGTSLVYVMAIGN